jgi:hypothetical protein
MAGELQIAMQVVKDQRAAINALEAELAALKEKLVALEGAVVEKFGAHGVLICQYSDPTRPDPERRKAAQAAIAYERPRVSAPQTHEVVHLFDVLERRRLEHQTPPLVEVTASDSDPAA